MSYTQTDRPLGDQGLFIPPDQPTRRRPRRDPVPLTEGSITPPEADVRFTLYDLKGREGPAPHAARVDVSGGVSRHFVKVAAAGPDRGHLLDPRGVFSKPEDALMTDPRGGRDRYEFRRVDEAVFDDYINYLRKHDRTFLGRAERAILNG